MIASVGVGGRLIANVGAGAPIGAAVGALTCPASANGGSLIGGDNNRGFFATAGAALAGLQDLDGLGGGGGFFSGTTCVACDEAAPGVEGPSSSDGLWGGIGKPGGFLPYTSQYSHHQAGM